MPQSLLKTNLIAYLNIKRIQLSEEIEQQNAATKQISLRELNAYVDEVIKMLNSTGRCFALAEIDASFSIVGYEEWWKETLVRIANWNHTNPKLLNELVDLTPYLPTTHQNPTPPKTLDIMFNEVLNYLVIEHSYVVSCIRPFMLEGISQATKLDPEKHFFELAINKKIYSITSRDAIAGHFPPQSLVNFLEKNKEQFIDNICMAHAEDHATNIKYRNGVWILYDSNYSHEKKETMQKEFTDVLELEKEIKIRLRTESIAIQIATINPERKIALDFYKKLKEEEIQKLLAAEGLHMVARYTPKKMDFLFNAITTQESTNIAFAKGLTYVNKSKWNGLHVIAHYAPEVLNKLFVLAEQNKILALHIAASLTQLNNDGWTPLHIMIRSNEATQGLTKLLALAEKSPVVAHALKKSMSINRKNGVTVDSMFFLYQPQELHIKALQLKMDLISPVLQKAPVLKIKPSENKETFFEKKTEKPDKKNKTPTLGKN